MLYKHVVQYYETDRMGITHHSNYVRWMEEARTYFLTEIGYPYDTIEAKGVISPVTSLSCDFTLTTTFSDIIQIDIKVSSVKSAKLAFVYEMFDNKQNLVFKGKSEHSFLSREGGFVNLKRQYPEFYQKLLDFLI